MNIQDLINRTTIPLPWAEGDNIPWNDPGFSERMLKEHLSQDHDAASRRFVVIEQHVAWIHQQILKSRPSRILDLGCGPGLYTNRLAKLGHACVGIDYSPASIRYARDAAYGEGLDCEYLGGDLRIVNYGDNYHLVMQIYGEINVFRPVDARSILQKAYRSLISGGILLIEAHTFDTVRRMGESKSTWYTQDGGLFSEHPYLCLEEHFWEATSQTATIRYYIIEAGCPQVVRYAQSLQAYTPEGYRVLLTGVGFENVELMASMSFGEASVNQDFIMIIAHRHR